MKLLLLFGAVVYLISNIQAKPQELITSNVQPTVKETFNGKTTEYVNENVNENVKENLKENVTEILDENQAKDLLKVKKHFSYHNGYLTHNSYNDNDKNQWHNAYKVFHLSYPLKANWFQAYEICKAKKWDLVVIDSQEKRKKVKDYLDTMDIDFKNFKDEIWTSGNDLGHEGSYLWMTTGQHLGSAELSFSIFDNKKHLNPLGILLQKIKSENCLAVFNKFGYGLTLNDDDCLKERFFLCEKLNHHHGGNHCDDEDDRHNHNSESSENVQESWDINDDNQNDELPENEDEESWDINDTETDNSEDQDSYFHNTSDNEESPEADSWDNIS